MRILKGGCNAKHSNAYRMSRPDGLTNYVILIIHTDGDFKINDMYYHVTPGYAVVLAPHTPYSYGNPDGDYIDDWLHFEPEQTDNFSQIFPYTNIPFPIGNIDTFTYLIKQILYENSYTNQKYSNQNIDALFTVLTNHLLSAYADKDAINKSSSFDSKLRLLRLELQNCYSDSEKYTISKCAKKLNVSESYFQHLYTNFFGISFQQDLINMRIEHAKYIMATTDLTLKEISEICGYSSEVHFYRQFKQIAGITPAKYRANQLSVQVL